MQPEFSTRGVGGVAGLSVTPPEVFIPFTELPLCPVKLPQLRKTAGLRRSALVAGVRNLRGVWGELLLVNRTRSDMRPRSGELEPSLLQQPRLLKPVNGKRDALHAGLHVRLVRLEPVNSEEAD